MEAEKVKEGSRYMDHVAKLATRLVPLICRGKMAESLALQSPGQHR